MSTDRGNLGAELGALREAVDRALDDVLTASRTSFLDNPVPERLLSAMRYAVLGGGKRLRPLLVLSACRAVGGRDELAMPAACAIELIHAYSLVHDDLPSMDDDEERRGRPTVHVEFGEPTAILTGDALLSEAFGVLADPEWEVAPASKLEIVRLMARAAGAAGMVGGQEHDMRAVSVEPTVQQVRTLHAMKTGALFYAAAVSGGIAAGASTDQVDALRSYGHAVGRAFQLTDDLLDVAEGSESSGDAHEDRVNLAVRLGAEAAREQGLESVRDATVAADSFGPSGELLRFIAEFVATRRV